ncbi:MAG: orotidine-5'-phosphate decarboxylase [Saprospiraceae bacterium]|nr:orotidine-5'-phosphate decarboxylase [Saprospiraceae bacterium]
MTRQQLFERILAKKSFLCIGLDSELSKLPPHLLRFDDPVYEFNRQIIEATHDLCVAYKPNLAFYESQGWRGWQTLEKTMSLIPENIFTIADAKRGDIGNTSTQYAQAFFKQMNFDAVTVAPYMGEDSVKPFLEFKGKWVILLALTSNKGSYDFQFAEQENGEPLFEKVMKKAQTWGNTSNLMFVTGATHPEKFKEIRRVAPDNFLLVPGIGAQGGELEKVCEYGLNSEVGLLVNSSRGIIFASNGEDFAEKARTATLEIQAQMAQVLDKHFR